AVVIAALDGADQASAAVVRERLPRVESFIHEVIVAAAVKLVASGPHREVEESSAHLAVFGCEVTGLNRNLLDGVDARLVLLSKPRQVTIRRFLTFNANSGGVSLRAIHAKQISWAGVGHARNQLRRGEGVTNSLARYLAGARAEHR